MIAVPAALLQAPQTTTLLRDGACCLIAKQVNTAAYAQPRLLTAHALTHVRKGQLDIETAHGDVLHVSAGDTVFLPKGSYFISDLLTGDDAFAAHVAFVDDALALQHTQPGVPSQQSAPLVLPAHKAIGQFHAHIHTQYAQEGHGLHALTRTKLSELLQLHLALHPDFQDALNRAQQGARLPLQAFMELHYTKPLTVAEFAALCGTSVATFRRECHRRLGEAPKVWLTRKRMTHAHRLLHEHGMDVQASMEASGYRNPSHFAQAFQRFHGKPPSQVRRHL